MDDFTASMRLCLKGREDELKYLLDIGINDDVDWYEIASECFIWLDNIYEDERTSEEIFQRQRLLELTGEYEEKHHRFGN